MRITDPLENVPYISAPVVLRRLLAVNPIPGHGDLDDLLNSALTAEKISVLIADEHGLRVSPTTITRWRVAGE